MTQKLSESITWTATRCEPSGLRCERCGGDLYRYTGPLVVSEWDSQRGVYNTHQTGETLPCHTCSWVIEGLVTEYSKLNHMMQAVDRQKRDNEPQQLYERRKERDGRIAESQRRELLKMVTDMGYTMVQVTNYLDASRRNQFWATS